MRTPQPLSLRSCLAAASLILLSGLTLQAGVNLTTSLPSPQPVGTMIRWTATTDSKNATWYRFRVREFDQNFTTIRDFGPYNELDWTAANHEGAYEFEITAEDRSTGTATTTSIAFDFTARVQGDQPVVSATENALVFLYSAPPCPAGQSFTAKFQDTNGLVQQTPHSSCDGTHTMNVYLAGMRSNATYEAWHELSDGQNLTTCSVTPFEAGEAPVQPPASELLNSNTDPKSGGVILHAPLFPNPPIATDTSGNLLWYYSTPISYLTTIESGGRFFGIVNSPGDQSAQTLREFDLAGMTLKETNAARVSQQLTSLGRRPIGGFHHDARRLADGSIVVLAGVEQMLPMLPMNGDDTLTDVAGDMVIVLDDDLQVKWVWDSFDHLDVHRGPILGETCAGGGCPKLILAPNAIDWTHSNSVQSGADGSLLISMRHQDWLVKIDYNNGAGSGDVLWRLGLGGDFAMDSPDPFPWFSHQHDAQFLNPEGTKILLFDNGNTRWVNDPLSNSRGQVLELDESTRTARLSLNADLGNFSFAMGSAQLLPSGNYHFDQPWLSNNSSIATEVSPSGDLLYQFRVSRPEYRTFRLPDVYTDPWAGVAVVQPARRSGKHGPSEISAVDGRGRTGAVSPLRRSATQ